MTPYLDVTILVCLHFDRIGSLVKSLVQPVKLKLFTFYSELELGPFLRPPKVSTTFTNLRIKEGLSTRWMLNRACSTFWPPHGASSLLFLLLTSLDLGGLASDLKNVIFRIGSSNKEFQKRYAISGARPDRGQIVDHSPFQHEREIRGLFLPWGGWSGQRPGSPGRRGWPHPMSIIMSWWRIRTFYLETILPPEGRRSRKGSAAQHQLPWNRLSFTCPEIGLTKSWENFIVENGNSLKPDFHWEHQPQAERAEPWAPARWRWGRHQAHGSVLPVRSTAWWLLKWSKKIKSWVNAILSKL